MFELPKLVTALLFKNISFLANCLDRNITLVDNYCYKQHNGGLNEAIKKVLCGLYKTIKQPSKSFKMVNFCLF